MVAGSDVEKRLRDIPAGSSFTFPKGTEDAGIRFTVLEQNIERALVVAVVGMAINPTYIFRGSEAVC